MISEKISHFQIKQKLGAGGMGEVYLAHDTQLDRAVALKILPSDFVNDHDRMRRFVREAKAASALSHSNVAHIYEIGQADGTHFIAMEYIQGETLAAKISTGGFDTAEIIRIGMQLADALDEAHSKGITHRDIKPANIMMTPRGQVKLLDFGLAKVRQMEELQSASEVATVTKTKMGVVLGTLLYMSPEQALGKEVDQRSDYFSLGAVLYQMATGNLPFTGKSVTEIADAILHNDPVPITRWNREVPPQLEKIISKMLAKDPADRYQTAKAILADLQQLQAMLISEATLKDLQRPFNLRNSIIIPALLLILLGLFLAFWLPNQKAKKIRWAKEIAIPEIGNLIDQNQYETAFQLASKAQQYIPEDPTLARLWTRTSESVSIETSPAGVEIYRKPYKAVDKEWDYLGRSPIHQIKLPLGSYRWKFSKPGYGTAYYVTPNTFPPQRIETMTISLSEEKSAPAGMVRIPGGKFSPQMSNTSGLQTFELDDFWMDQFEVTNRQFKDFVHKRGYQNPIYWKNRFLKEGVEISREEAMARFLDTTGRPGPRNWQAGDYQKGQENYPVSGISWYEGAAYCEFVGKNLPTVYHWTKASGTVISSEIVPLSNFAGVGLAPVGTYQGMNIYGTFDMAGNVKEWCWNEIGEGKRFILGGAWDEPDYMFSDADSRFPIDRSANNGFRCIKPVSKPVSSAALRPLDLVLRDFKNEKPVPDNVFQYFRSFYSYDKTNLKAVSEVVDKTQKNWIKEKVTFDTAYGNERMTAYLYLPKNSSPPYQTVIYFPSGAARREPTSENFDSSSMMDRVDFIIKSGRALVLPILKGSFERRLTSNWSDLSPTRWRDLRIQQSKDLGRTIDYLETRREFDLNKLAYFGISWGGSMGAILPAIENRLKVAVLIAGGIDPYKVPPEADPINFLPHIKIPILMVNGRYDHDSPVETNQKPVFRLIGTPEKDKRHAVYECGHAVPINIMAKETLNWLDRYLGPVN